MNRHIIIGWLRGDSKLMQDFDFTQGKNAAKDLEKTTGWRPVYSGSLIDLITLLEKEVSAEHG